MSVQLLQSNSGGTGTGVATASTSAVGYGRTTTAGSLLVCVVWAYAYSTTNPTIALLQLPTTSGVVWTQAGRSEYAVGMPIGGPPTSGFGGAAGIYYISNAPSLLATTTTIASCNSGYDSTIYIEFSLYEFSNIMATDALDAEEQNNSGSSDPSTANLPTTETDLIMVAYQATGKLGVAGSGYTLGVNAKYVGVGQTQYILNQPAGSVATAFGTSQTYWCCIASAFISSTGYSVASIPDAFTFGH